MTSSPDPAAKAAATHATEEPIRRGFLYKLVTIAFGSVLLLAPLIAAVGVLFDPLRKRQPEDDIEPTPTDDDFVRVTRLDVLPADGVPHPFTVKKDVWDAWNYYPNQRVGIVFLRRMPESDEIFAFNATCPHAGCMVSFKPAYDEFRCPCHDSAFEADGARVNPLPGGKTNPAPRSLDSLEVRVTEGGDVLVKYEDFYTGRPEKDPVT